MTGWILTPQHRIFLLLRLMVFTLPAHGVTNQVLEGFSDVNRLLPSTKEDLRQEHRLIEQPEVVTGEHVFQSFPYEFEGQPPVDRRRTSSFKVFLAQADGGEGSTPDHQQHLQHFEKEGTDEREGQPFPYTFEGQPPRERQPQTEAVEPPERKRLNEVVNTAQNLNLPPLLSLSSVFSPQTQEKQGLFRWPSRPFSKTETNVLFLLASIAVKLVMSTALASWFLAAGQILYDLAAVTGTTTIFGMDSAIKFIYLSLPYAEALLRGETNLTG